MIELIYMTRFRAITLVGAGLVLLTIAAAPGYGDELNASELRSRLDTLDAELEAEKQAFAEERAADAAAIETRQQRVREKTIQLAREQAQLDRLERQVNEANQLLPQIMLREDDIVAARERIDRRLAESAEQLHVRLGELPGYTQVREQIAAAMTALNNDTDPAAQAAARKAILQLLDEVWRDTRRVEVVRRSIRLTDGQQVEVELLRIGHVGFAWRHPEHGVGLAVASPGEARGYRWAEPGDAQVADAVRRAIEQLERGEGERVTVPLDVTGRVKASDLTAGTGGWWLTLISGGPVMLPLLVLAIIGLVLVAERARVLFLNNRIEPLAAERIIATVRAGETDAAIRICETRRGTMGRVLGAILKARDGGQLAMEDAVQAQLLDEWPRLQRFLSGIAILAAVAPLLGLLGTVTGIIRTFGVIRAFGNTDPTLMAGGVSEALVTTAAGLVIAIPLLLLHGMLRGRVDRIIAEAERHAANLLNLIAHPTVYQDEASPSLDRAADDQPGGQP